MVLGRSAKRTATTSLVESIRPHTEWIFVKFHISNFDYKSIDTQKLKSNEIPENFKVVLRNTTQVVKLIYLSDSH